MEDGFGFVLSSFIIKFSTFSMFIKGWGRTRPPKPPIIRDLVLSFKEVSISLEGWFLEWWWDDWFIAMRLGF